MDQVVLWVSLTPDIGTLAWAPLNCSGGSPASRTTRAHSPALGRTRDYSDREICHKSRTRNPRAGGPRGDMGRNRIIITIIITIITIIITITTMWLVKTCVCRQTGGCRLCRCKTNCSQHGWTSSSHGRHLRERERKLHRCQPPIGAS